SRGEGAHRVCRTRMSSKCTALHGAAASHPGHAIAPDGFVTLFTCQTARVSSFPRRVFAPGFCFLASRTLMKGWRSAERRTDACEAPVAALGGRQATSEAPRVPIRGTPASRRSHRGDFGLRAALPLTGISAGSVTANSHIRVIVPGGGPLPPGAAVTSHGRGTPRLAPPSGCLRTTPLEEQD